VNPAARIQVFPGGCLVHTSREDGDVEIEHAVIFPDIKQAVAYVTEFLVKYSAEEEESAYVI